MNHKASIIEHNIAGWQHRIFYEDTNKWSEWRYGRRDQSLANMFEERKLYSDPAPVTSEVDAKAEVDRILDGWFGESLENAEDEDNRRRFLYEPLRKLARERDRLIEAGLKCCDGTYNPELPKLELALSFIDSTNTARKAADKVWQDYKVRNEDLAHQLAAAKMELGETRLVLETTEANVKRVIDELRAEIETLATSLAKVGS